MSRTALIATATMGLALFGAVPATAAQTPAVATTAAAATSAATTVTCSPFAIRAGLATEVCVEVTGNNVQLYGEISLAGPPSPGYPIPVKDLTTTLTGNVTGGAFLGQLVKPVRFHASTVRVSGISDTVPCGSTVHAEFTSTALGYPAVPVIVDAPVAC
ncbi:hypothetical protein [Streptomyces sp. NPDC050504]|uniref:hypothetical protein n=1 Tax=Streptomyces sp. NPDC050504 TaxID=3365618 RepID=UPI0037A6EB31